MCNPRSTAAAAAAEVPKASGMVEQLAKNFGGAGRLLDRLQEAERRDRERSPKRGPGVAGHGEDDPIDDPDKDENEDDSKSFASLAGSAAQSVTSAAVAAAAKRVAETAAEGERAKGKLQKAAAKAAGMSRG